MEVAHVFGTGFIFTRPGTEGMLILLPEARILPRAGLSCSETEYTEVMHETPLPTGLGVWAIMASRMYPLLFNEFNLSWLKSCSYPSGGGGAYKQDGIDRGRLRWHCGAYHPVSFLCFFAVEVRVLTRTANAMERNETGHYSGHLSTR